jgi:MFS family permease
MSEMVADQSVFVSKQQRYLPLLVLLFIGSGCAALIYEVVWFQILELVIGSSSLSLGILLGTFMGGMCVGSLFAPRVVSRLYHPLRVYAYLELGIGVLGLLILVAVPLVGNVYTAWAGSGTASMLLRGIIAGICLLPPTFLMGATLPAISRWVETSPEGVSWLGFFYGGNIAGAVAGSLLAGFYLLRVYDVAIATFAAVAINVLVAVLGLVIANMTPYKAAVVEGFQSAQTADAEKTEVWPIYLTIALSGFTALSSEVVWTRLLSLLFGATVYTFSLVLAAFLFGLGIGSSIGAAIARKYAKAAHGIGLVPDVVVCRDCVGCISDDVFHALVADQRRIVELHHGREVPAGYGALPVGAVAGFDPVGRKLPAGIGLCRSAGSGRGPHGRWRLRRQHCWRHLRRPAREPDVCLFVRHAAHAAGFDRRVGDCGLAHAGPGSFRTGIRQGEVEFRRDRDFCDGAQRIPRS